MAGGLSEQEVIAAADAIAARDGAQAVSLRRVRAEIGRGSLQTIHRHLAAWRSLQTYATAGARAETVIPVRFLPPESVDGGDWQSALDPHRGRDGAIDVRKGVPEGLVHLQAEEVGIIIVQTLNIPWAQALVSLKPIKARGRRGEDNPIIRWDRGYAGIVVPASAAVLILKIADHLQNIRSLDREREVIKYHQLLQAERAVFAVHLDAVVYRALEAKAQGRRMDMGAYLTEIITQAGA